MTFVSESTRPIPQTAIGEFCAFHPFLAVFAILAITAISFMFLYCAHYAFCFAIRHRTLRLKGYPPAHCDGDGDFPKTSKDKL